ncbi:hypothetical protein GUITHDRAFT_98434 [Guillardia theta CCMP2712]|uniref:Transmembrane protein 17 n=2 Tax=Guillardia theta TaxID=55529 RepID=L1IA55_GUITC|nr:hypothetical protein GUITHDRAFT_98434 [Guillardia theta CCMP2712]EKX33113.1 hypothetical protein GUITHDRAFT_98434 [Guillardia theta CCMP2712]|mmetsp:Transcript_30531/g.98375  ORF Transcript_30531/g.98375 Transcript_30531/m.98375 type:complete len:201 (+) Transcript_30531:96-698(+)|eukprot:XP_005820093.1 hypothetical protein GUITHDRAFT_98434 [Guillardia theta CCMP2712]
MSKTATKRPGMIARGLTSLSGRLFAQVHLSQEQQEELGNDEELMITNTQIASSLPLQMLLYFNVFYSIFWGALTLALMLFKENYLIVNQAYKVLSPLVLSVWFLLEPVRLYLGFVGNLQEKVPQLTGFWLLTLIPQLPIAFFFVLSLPVRVSGLPLQLSFDLAGSIILTVFVFLEVIVGFFALRSIVRSQVLKFHMQVSR